MPIASIREIIAANKRAIEAMVAKGAGTELTELLEDAQDDLRARLTKALRAWLRERFTGAQLAATRTLVQQAIVDAKIALKTHVTVKQRQAARRSSELAARFVRVCEKKFDGVARELPLEIAMRMEKRLHGVLASRLRQMPTSVDRYGYKMIAEFERNMRVGMVNGLTVEQMTDMLVGLRGPKGKSVSLAATVTPTGKVKRILEGEFTQGLFVEHRYWAERIVRTEMMYASNMAQQAEIEAQADVHFDMRRMIIAVMDGHTAYDSLFVHGEVRGVHDEFIDGAGRSYLVPPARPNDREIIIPYRTSWPRAEFTMPLPTAERRDAAEEAGGADDAETAIEQELRRRKSKGAGLEAPPRRITDADLHAAIAEGRAAEARIAAKNAKEGR